jgi:DNA-nicking Smr family endonuclease
VVEAAPASTQEESLVPKYHIDEFGNKIDDVTGGRVWSEAYYRARKDAEFHAQERGRCFEASKKAFEEDRKKEAKELSDEGKMHGQKMEEANQRAVDEIIKPQQLETSVKIDLHGLLVAEAVNATKEFVKAVIANRGDSVDKLEIITGAGHHSDKAKGPVIKPAIIKMCEEEGWKLVADEGNEGSFTLILKDAPVAAEPTTETQ